MLQNNYQEKKAQVREQAIEWQNDFSNNNYSHGELNYFYEYFLRMAKRYGLVREFKENGIV